MEFKEDPENNVSRSGSLFGAIFMCNRCTKKECLERSLFGLPFPQINFVKKVKDGMILFLFEYEERKLYGVFQASSDGAMNIVPQAFSSTGKQIPAQIRVKKIWNCVPLSEPDFCDALRDNYYAPKKFNFGLSKDQVQKLLLLFSARKLHRRQQNPTARVKARTQKAKSGMGRVRLTNYEGRCLTKNSVETVVGMHNGMRTLTKYTDLPGSGLKNHSGTYDKLIKEREDCREEDQHRLSAVAPHSMQPQIPKFCSTSQDNQHVAIPSGNSYLSRDPRLLYRPFEEDHSFPANLHAPADSLFQQSRGQVIPSYSEPQNLIKFSARQPQDVAHNLGDYLPLDCQDIASQGHLRHNQDDPNDLGDYIPLSCNSDFEPSRTGIIFPETDCFGNKNIEPNDFEGYKRLSFHEPPLATIPFSRMENYGRGNREGMQHWNYVPSTAAMSMSSEQMFHPDVSFQLLDSRGIEPDGLTDHNEYRCHLGRQYDTQNTRINYRHEEYGDQLGLHHDSQNAKISDRKYDRGMYSDTRRDSVFSRLTLPQETITGDDNRRYIDKGDMMDMSVDQLMELVHQNQSRCGQLTKRLQRVIEHCNDDNSQHKKKRGSEMSEDAIMVNEKDKSRKRGSEMSEDAILVNEEDKSRKRGAEMSEDAILVNEEDKSHKRGAEDDLLVNFKRRREVGKVRDETVGVSGTPGKRRKLRRPSFGTIITEEGKENGKQTQEEISLESKTFLVDASIRETDDRVKPKDQSLEIGSNATTAVSFGGGDSVTETEQKELLLASSSTCETKELSFDTIITVEGKENGKQTQEEVFLESKAILVDACIRETGDRVKPKDQSREMGTDATTAVSFVGGDSVTETEPKELLLPPPSTCETKELSFDTIITVEGKENGKQTQEEVFLESKAILVDACIRETGDRVKPKDQSREMGTDATTAVSFVGGDSVTETEPKELLLPPPSTFDTKELSGCQEKGFTKEETNAVCAL